MSTNNYCGNQPRAIPDLVENLANENAKQHHIRHYNNQGSNVKYYNNYQTPYVPQMYGNFYQKPRYMPYPSRNLNQSNQSNHFPQSSASVNYGSSNSSANKSLNSSLNSSSSDSGKNTTFYSSCSSNSSLIGNSSNTSQCSNSSGTCNGTGSNYNCSFGNMQSTLDQKEMVVLQISNLDPSIDEHKMHQYLLCQLKSITPVLSLAIESPSLAKVKVPSAQFAKLVVANLHRKKIGHKRMVVSYIKDPSSAESSALRCQVAGLLKDVPYYSLPINKFRELFQSRFKSSISVLDLYRMPDVCSITLDKNEEKYICLQPDVINSLQNNPLIESSQHSVPYCIYHFKQEKEKGWAEQEIEPLPSVMMSISQLQSLIYSLLKTHKDDIPVASILYCIENELQVKIVPNDNGVPLEHLLCCIRGVQITNNNFGIKVLTWLDHELNSTKDNDDAFSANLRYMPKGPSNDFLQQISREVVELIKMSPKSAMKFTRFIPAYHNHFGKQCRVADYGYTRLIELFEALAPVVQVMGDGENRQITLTHRTQIRRFTSDLLKILRGQANKSILLSQLPIIFSQAQNKIFDVTDYGVCDIFDIIDGLVYNNSIVTKVYNETDVLISIVKRKQTPTELEKTCVFAGEVVELFKNAPQYSILFKKFVRSYHYHFGYQCRLSDYGLMKLADLLEAISGIVEMEQTNDEDRKIYLNHKVAIRIFSEQIQDIIKHFTGSTVSMIRLSEILNFHKNKYGYQIQPCCLGFSNMCDVIKALPYMEIFESGNDYMVISHIEDPIFRLRSYAACLCIIDSHKDYLSINDFLRSYLSKFKETLTEKQIYDMKHVITIEIDNGNQAVTMTPLMKFIVQIIHVLKQRSPINLFDLKHTLNISLCTCFKFGYPNISSLITAFPDIFISNSFLHEGSDIELNRDCILSKACFSNGDKLPTRAGVPAMSNSAPASTKILVDENKFSHVSMTNDFRKLFYRRQDAVAQQNLLHQQQQQQQHLQKPLQPLQPSQQMNHPPPVSFYPNNRFNTPMLNANYNLATISSSYTSSASAAMANDMMATHNQTMNMKSHSKENLYHSYSGMQLQQQQAQQLSQQQQQMMSSQSKFATMTANMCAAAANISTATANAAGVATGQVEATTLMGSSVAAAAAGVLQNSTAKLHERRHQHSLSLQYLNCNNSGYGLLPEFYEPPKPDSPPSRNIPYWLDPIWTSDTILAEKDIPLAATELLNIPLPELKTYNKLPIILTPYILSLGKHPSFSFDIDKSKNI
ncbi:meiosis regulator and mRNA stability factor 1 isoform X2 [Toxorhynchites rutilus septentrionalis]|uniref:meiosis regulator and mRNA stability factor 1 isoform X2 n=1 Tax=Toxorhynchites rutilus septentrionalis TaxID=329112 RepID=UPI002479352C|nr:meiosis regulator and mRNA stability factor 1 isoform X2 [Toxorhynchites rutilus septentrionalis]